MKNNLKTIISLIKKVAEDEIDDRHISGDTHLYNDLGFDSLTFLSLVLLLKNEFNLGDDIYSERFTSITTVGQIDIHITDIIGR